MKPATSFRLLPLLLATASFLPAQFTEATVKGVITDSTHAAVVVAVSATNENTGESRNSVTDSRGAYVLAELPPGTYRVFCAQ